MSYRDKDKRPTPERPFIYVLAQNEYSYASSTAYILGVYITPEEASAALTRSLEGIATNFPTLYWIIPGDHEPTVRCECRTCDPWSSIS